MRERETERESGDIAEAAGSRRWSVVPPQRSWMLCSAFLHLLMVSERQRCRGPSARRMLTTLTR